MPSTVATPNPPSASALSAEDAAALARMRRLDPEADPVRWLGDVPPSRVPRHVAIIMDGNGRWAQSRGLSRIVGHHQGAPLIRRMVEEAGRLGIERLTMYSFSLENWKRPAVEVDALMDLYCAYMQQERAFMVRKNIRYVQIGRREGLPDAVLAELDENVRATHACTGTTLCLAVNYGSRAEITDAARSLARDAAAGKIDPQQIDEAMLASRLYTAGAPDPDLLVRTAGEMRVSNYLLWQISYAELYVTETLWPDFTEESLRQAVRAYASRKRTFGGLPGQPSAGIGTAPPASPGSA